MNRINNYEKYFLLFVFAFLNCVPTFSQPTDSIPPLDSLSAQFSGYLDITNSILAPLIVALITGLFTWILAQRKNQKKIDAAPRKYVEQLDILIKNGVAGGVENAVLNARAIVSARNSLRNSLVAISSQLNSEIDRLAIEIGEDVSRPQGPSSRDRDRRYLDINAQVAYNTILVLSKVWPAKKEQIEVEIRKLLAEMGLSFRVDL